MTGDEVLKTALKASANEYFSMYDITDNEKKHRFSLAYRIRKASVIRFAKKSESKAPEELPRKKYISLKRLSVTVAAVITAAFLAAAAGASYLISVRGFSFNVHEKYSDVSVDFSEYTIKETIEEIYRLPPESGYELADEISESNINISEYICGDKSLNLVQYTKSFAESLYANTENSEIRVAEVNGNPGYILVHRYSDGNEIAGITWVYDEYVFEIIEPSEDELIGLAEMLVLK